MPSVVVTDAFYPPRAHKRNFRDACIAVKLLLTRLKTVSTERGDDVRRQLEAAGLTKVHKLCSRCNSFNACESRILLSSPRPFISIVL